MLFTALLHKAGLATTARGGDGDPVITGVTGDSRTVRRGDLFVAISGTRLQGEAFIADAARRGAAAVVAGGPAAACAVPWAAVANPRAALGLLGKAFWSVNVDAMKLTGITGTNGKTTTAYLYKKLFEQKYGADAVWMFGTIEYQLGKERTAAPHTTPESLDMFRLIGTAATPPRALVTEVSSHSLALDRVAGLAFDVAVFTNLTQDHLDFHTTMEQYYQAKKRLFTDYLKSDGRAVVNIDDQYGERLVRELGAKRCLTFGKAGGADVRIAGAACTWDGTTVDLCVAGRNVQAHSALRGCFNVYNMTGLYAGALALSFDHTAVERAFAAIETVPGRMDRVVFDAPFAVVVDYAHTPDALVNILATARSLTKGKVICVFGCGGDRDRTKRPLMASAVADSADEAVVTSDNPRSEDPEAIIDEVLRGMPLDFPHRVEVDRRRAIGKALETARAGDCVVIAGKGHEDYQEIKGVKHPFDDRAVAAQLYDEMNKNA